jgi:hypothetical protein
MVIIWKVISAINASARLAPLACISLTLKISLLRASAQPLRMKNVVMKAAKININIGGSWRGAGSSGWAARQAGKRGGKRRHARIKISVAISGRINQ